jgi:tetratricopeptide (TPR) repeat protein
VRRRQASVARLCSQGKVLASEGDGNAAKQRYLAALRLDADSECAVAGLAPPEKGSDAGKSWVATANDWIEQHLKFLGLVLGTVLIGFAFVLIGALVWRRHKPSLSVEAFEDGAIEPKVGSTVAALVEKRLLDVFRVHRAASEEPQLDVVAADVEILAANKDLETALGGLAEVSQLKLLVAVLGLVDRIWGTHLTAKGELAPKGRDGYGVVLALQSEKGGLEARGAVWSNEGWRGQGNPNPYYELAEPAAAWVQYETACNLNAGVRLITRDAQSFSLMSLGLMEQRALREAEAIEQYAAALRRDPENFVALFNLGGILASDPATFWTGLLLQVRGLFVLESRYEELE